MKKAPLRFEALDIFANLPVEIKTIFETPPLLHHEDPKLYESLLVQFVQETKPTDLIEWMWLKDLADLTWEIIRYRRIKAGLINVSRKKAIAEILRWLKMSVPDVIEEAMSEVDAEYYFLSRKSKRKIDSLLKKYDLGSDAIVARSFAMNYVQLEAAEKILASSEIRRNNLIQDIEIRRERLGRALRHMSDKMIEHSEPSTSPSKLVA